MNKTALVIMAAGMGSRYGGGIKQLERVGTSGEIIMEYSVYDAIAAGFDKIVFITRKDLLDDFKEIINPEIEKKAEVEYVFQELENLPAGFTVPEGRKKPWGTGHAILSCLGTVKEPFAVINADDYYGSEAFKVMHDFLANADTTMKPADYSMVGFVLRNTLSENGKVTRGVCRVSKDGILETVNERFDIAREGDIATAKDADGNALTLDLDAPVSMNMWGLMPNFIDELNDRFKAFLGGIAGKELKAEFLLPEVVRDMIDEKFCTVKVLRSSDRWFGVTYHEDKDFVVKSFRELCDKGIYPEKLFG